jgi:hypothetical protein
VAEPTTPDTEYAPTPRPSEDVTEELLSDPVKQLPATPSREVARTKLIESLALLVFLCRGSASRHRPMDPPTVVRTQETLSGAETECRS